MIDKIYKGIEVYYRINDIVYPKFVVNVDRGKRFFLNFASIYHFERWYDQLHPAEKTMNEVIMSDRRKLIIDIDDSDTFINDALHMFDFERHITARIRDVFLMLEIGIPDVIIYKMVDESGEMCYSKLSYHVVVSNFSFTAATCKGLCMMISSGQIWDKCVDTSIYKSVQCIRMKGSTKFKEKRWKHANKGTFEQSMVSYIKNTIKSEFICNLSSDTIQKFTYFSLYNVNPLQDVSLLSQFKICKKNAYISLHRIKPGYCPQCNRIHYRENAIIKYIMGHPTFVCWRYKLSGITPNLKIVKQHKM